MKTFLGLLQLDSRAKDLYVLLKRQTKDVSVSFSYSQCFYLVMLQGHVDHLVKLKLIILCYTERLVELCETFQLMWDHTPKPHKE